MFADEIIAGIRSVAKGNGFGSFLKDDAGRQEWSGTNVGRLRVPPRGRVYLMGAQDYDELSEAAAMAGAGRHWLASPPLQGFVAPWKADTDRTAGNIAADGEDSEGTAR